MKIVKKKESLGLCRFLFERCKEMRLRRVKMNRDRVTKRKATKPKKLCKHGTMTTKTLYQKAYCDLSNVPPLSDSVNPHHRATHTSHHHIPPEKKPNQHILTVLCELNSGRLLCKAVTITTLRATNSLIPFDPAVNQIFI